MVKIQFKRANKNYLEAHMQPFASGEPLYEQDTGKMKIGDGVTLYKDLPYINPDQEEIPSEKINGLFTA